MSAKEIDQYLAGVPEPKRGTLQALRLSILQARPDAEQGIAYGLPAFRISGKAIAGFGAFKNHLAYLPHSGSVLPEMAADLASFKQTKGSLHFPVDDPLSDDLVRKLIEVRMKQAFPPQ